MNNESIYTYSESDGPFTCEHSGCKEEAWCIQLTKAETQEVLEYSDDRYERSRLVIKNKMGKALCDDHLKTAFDVQESNGV